MIVARLSSNSLSALVLFLGLHRHVERLVPLLLAGCDDRAEDIRQCSVYGLGLLAEHVPQAFGAVLPQALERIMKIIAHPEARGKDIESVTDNAVSALGKALEHHAAAMPNGGRDAAAVYVG
jgi:importin-5